MPYVEGRVVHDADSHIFEPPGTAVRHADPQIRARLAEAVRELGWGPKAEAAVAQQHDPAFRARDESELMLRKDQLALGAVLAEDRPRALDLLGFASQLVFTTSYLAALRDFERGDDLDLMYGLALAHNRAIVEFCSTDRRLLPVGYLPLGDIERSIRAAGQAIELGVAALMIPSHPLRAHSQSHVGLDPIWARAQDAGVPIVFHVGGEEPMPEVYKRNGLPPVPDFHGGDANFTSVSYLAIPYAPMQTLGTMIYDGVLDRFPRLRVGVIELGASWVPGWMRALDSGAEAFRKNEDRLQRLSLKPSEFVRRQVRVTPYPHEPAGWIVQNSAPEIMMFSSDYPHVEGGRNPLRRFETSLAGCTAAEQQAFYCDNFLDLIGPRLAALSGS
ncbi:MAG TPA: amidohydrolase family protein [Kofleriaceae bacterium]|jgi:predicted TIM-barrel fold metal-dependent hydrolase|nr:amidohydrolase family protein [Kofleriaceae bacterium]